VVATTPMGKSMMRMKKTMAGIMFRKKNNP
jgi:hypothetical protein